MKLRTQAWTVIDESDLSALVADTYGRPFRLQQQGDCLPNDSIHHITVSKDGSEGFIGGYGSVPLSEWLTKDPSKEILNPQWETIGQHLPDDHPSKKFYPKFIVPDELWWERHFYPDFSEVLDDLLERELIDEGQYAVNVYW